MADIVSPLHPGSGHQFSGGRTSSELGSGPPPLSVAGEGDSGGGGSALRGTPPAGAPRPDDLPLAPASAVGTRAGRAAGWVGALGGRPRRSPERVNFLSSPRESRLASDWPQVIRLRLPPAAGGLAALAPGLRARAGGRGPGGGDPGGRDPLGRPEARRRHWGRGLDPPGPRSRARQGRVAVGGSGPRGARSPESPDPGRPRAGRPWPADGSVRMHFLFPRRGWR